MKNKFMKQFVALALSLIMLIGIMPMPAFAVAYNTYDVSGRTQSGENTAFIRYGLTDDAAGSFSVVDNETSVQLNLTLNDGWYLEKWDTWFNGGYDKAWDSDPSYDESNPFIDGSYTFSNISQRELPVNYNDYIRVDKLVVLYGDFRVNAVVRPILTVNAGNGVSYQVTANNAISVEQRVAVEYGKNASVTYSVDDKHVITGISANYGTQYADNGSVVTVSSIVRPATVNISTRLKQQTVNFNANGGEGTMSAQTFEHSVAQELTANAFTKNGYTFAGWNTKVDNSGTSYANMASVSFTPANDGDSITLYAQWTQCTDHNWEDGKCTKCGALCSHSGGNATCIEQATCDICGEKYGDLAKHNVVYNASQNRIVETCTADCGHIATADIVRNENVGTVYSGSAIEALKVVYSDNWQSGNLDIQYVENVNVGTASGTISIGGKTAKETFEITAATMTNISAQGYSGVYDGQAHGITVNAPAGASISYKVGDGNYSTENPVLKDAGTYTVAYKVSMANHTDVEGTAEVEIDKAPLTVTADAKSKAYGEGDPALTWSITGGALVNGEQLTGITISRVSGENTNTYVITVSQADGANKNYDITFVEGTFTINAKTVDATVVVNGAPFTYNGSKHEPEIVVKDGDTVIPANEYEVGYANNINAGTATVTITDKEGGNYVVNGTATFIINKADPFIGTVGVDGVVNDSTKPSDVVLTRTNTTVDGVLTLADNAMLANKSTYRWVFTPTDTDNYNVINGDVPIDVLDTVLPIAVIKVDTNEWKQFINNITFGLFFKETQEVTIIAADNENGSGIKDVVYFVSNREYEADELRYVEWKSYTEAFDIEPDGKYVIYAKVTDNDGNTIVINSDGVVVDETAAVVSGITDGETYYGQIVFTVTDELAGVKSVVIDGSDETHFEGQYVINGDNAEHKVVVTDNAGNVTEYKVTVYKNHTVTYTADGEPISTETVGHGKDATPPAVPAKNGYTGKWDHDGKNITSDIIINAVYTENSTPVPSDPQSPQTGDNSNMALWIALLLISGGALIALTVVERKKRTVNR